MLCIANKPTVHLQRNMYPDRMGLFLHAALRGAADTKTTGGLDQRKTSVCYLVTKSAQPRTRTTARGADPSMRWGSAMGEEQASEGWTPWTSPAWNKAGGLRAEQSVKRLKKSGYAAQSG